MVQIGTNCTNLYFSYRLVYFASMVQNGTKRYKNGTKETNMQSLFADRRQIRNRSLPRRFLLKGTPFFLRCA